jgi:hypothetical protein
LIRKRIVGQRGKVWDEILKIKMSPQLEEPPGTSSSKFFLGKKAQGHQIKVSVNFSKEQFTKANIVTFGQLVRQRKVILGWSKGRSTEKEVL